MTSLSTDMEETLAFDEAETDSGSERIATSATKRVKTGSQYILCVTSQLEVNCCKLLR